MSADVTVIWKKGEGEMPEKAAMVVDAARSELLLKALQLPEDMENAIKYNSDKTSQSVYEYVSNILIQQLKAAS